MTIFLHDPDKNPCDSLLTIILVFACSCVFQHRTGVASVVIVSAVFIVSDCCTLHILKLKQDMSHITT